MVLESLYTFKLVSGIFFGDVQGTLYNNNINSVNVQYLKLVYSCPPLLLQWTSCSSLPKRRHHLPIQIESTYNCLYFYSLSWQQYEVRDSPQGTRKCHRSRALAGTWQFLTAEIPQRVLYMDRKCSTLAVYVRIVPSLRMTGDLNNCARGKFTSLCSVSAGKSA